MTFITADQVAKITGHTDGRAFLAARLRLERDHQFPPPLPTCLRPLKWRTTAVQAWMDAQGDQTVYDIGIRPPNVHLLHQAKTA